MSSNNKNIWKNIHHLCFSKLRRCPPPPPPLPRLPPPPSTPQDHDRLPLRPKKDHSRSSTTCGHASDDSTSKSLTTDDFPSTSDDSETSDPPADFAAAFASHRFFFSSPGRSNSIVEDSKPPPPGDTAVAVHTLSPDPYSDFRRSMQEMVEACGRRVDVKRDWDYLQELLVCYLALNPEHTHKFILGAYADLIVDLVSSNSGDRADSRRRRSVS